jgi:cytochrome bd-type quinol oxidase subunit 2
MDIATLVDWHHTWAWVVVVLNAVVGAWALAAHRFEVLRHRALWWSVGVAQVSILLQVALGVLLVNRQERDLPGMHAFYGFASLAAVGIIFSYRSQLKGKVYLLYGGGSLFLAGMLLRAIYLPPF